jgi:hypothetical protein
MDKNDYIFLWAIMITFFMGNNDYIFMDNNDYIFLWTRMITFFYDQDLLHIL